MHSTYDPSGESIGLIGGQIFRRKKKPTCTDTQPHTHTHTHTHRHRHTDTHTKIHTHIHTHTHTDKDAYTHTRARAHRTTYLIHSIQLIFPGLSGSKSYIIPRISLTQVELPGPPPGRLKRVVKENGDGWESAVSAE